MGKDYCVENKTLMVEEPLSAPMVSVAVIAYNVGKYISETIESVLSQKTNFKFELVIGEDCSTDNTREIILEYQKKYPNIIKPLLHQKNLGLTPNSVATQNACKGKYIALLDGDDYWTDDNKLQQQVAFLEKNLGFSGAAHQARIIFDDMPGEDRFFGAEQDEVYGVKDTLKHRKFHTSSLIYRRDCWTKTGGIPPLISSNERAIYPMVASFGKIKYFKESMCIYRRSSIGLSARITYEELLPDLLMLPWLKSIDANFPVFQLRSFLYYCIYTSPVKKKAWPLIKYHFLFVFYSFSYFPQNLGDVKYGTITLFKYLKKSTLFD